MRRRVMVALLFGSALGGAACLAAETPVEIRISAKKFEYHPNKVTAKLGRRLNDNGARDVLWQPGATRDAKSA